MANYFHGSGTATTTAAVLLTSRLQNAGVVVSNAGPATAYLGGSTVTADQTSTGGLSLAAGDRVRVPTAGNINADLYVVTAADTAVLSWLSV